MARRTWNPGTVAVLALVAFTAAIVLAVGFLVPRDRTPPKPFEPPGESTPSFGGATAQPRSREGASPLRREVPFTRLPLRLLATVVHEKAQRSLATLEDLEHTESLILREGDPFERYPNVELAKIERGRVLIDNDGMLEQLRSRSGRVASEGSLEPRARPDALDRAEADFRDALGGDERGGLLAEGQHEAIYAEGELVGFQIDAIRAGGLYEKIGLRDGDLVSSVNGVSFGEDEAAAKLLAELLGSDDLSVAVERSDGSQELLVVPTAEFRDRLETPE